MYFAHIFLAGASIGGHSWSKHEERYPSEFNILMKAIDDNRAHRFDTEEFRLVRSSLGMYQARSLPMYYRFLSENPDSPYFYRVLLYVDSIDKHCKAFVPLVKPKLADPRMRNSVLIFLTKHGGRNDAKAVVDLFLDLDLKSDEINLALACLSKIGGREELNPLRQFAVNKLQKNPKSVSQYGVDWCCRAIELRVEAEEKDLAATLYNYAPPRWRDRPLAVESK